MIFCSNPITGGRLPDVIFGRVNKQFTIPVEIAPPIPKIENPNLEIKSENADAWTVSLAEIFIKE